jgi:hypothetical protein
MKQAMQITTNGTVNILELGDEGLGVLQGAVGGWVQAVDLTDTLTMWLNEEGKLEGLPHNPFAQYLWDNTYGAHTDYIVGNAVFTGGTDDEGATLGLSDEAREDLTAMVAKVRRFTEARAEIIY